MPVSHKRPPVTELLNNAVAQQEKVRVTRTEILVRPYHIWLKKGGSSRKYGAPSDKGGDGDGDLEADSHSGKGPRMFRRFSLEKIVAMNSKAGLGGDSVWSSLRSMGSSDDPDDWKSQLYKFIVLVSLNCERILQNQFVRYTHLVMWPIAFSVLVYETPQADYSINSQTDFNFYVLDAIINTWFLVYGVCKLLGLHMRIRIEKAYQRKVTVMQAIVDSGAVQLLACCLCLGYGITETGLWIRLVRLALTTSTVLDLFPHMSVLVSGITHGLRSIAYTLVCFFLLILAYASVGHYLFAVNDPFHFGTYAIAALTFFQLITFENWSTIYYSNFGGCDTFPTEYSGNVHYGATNVTTTVHTSWGDFALPVCAFPEPQPTAASFVFISFVISGGYVIVSMCLAAVAIGINERLLALRVVDVYGGDMARGGQAATTAATVKAPAAGGTKAAKLIGNLKEKALMKALLMKIWGAEGGAGGPELKRGKSSPARGGAAKPQLLDDEDEEEGALSAQMLLHYLTSSPYHDGIISALILADAGIQIYNEGYAYSRATFGLHCFIQSVFVVDYALRFYQVDIANRFKFVRNFWNLFDVVISAIIVATLCLDGKSDYDWLRFVRFVRLARILKLYSTQFGDLHVIIASLSNSFVCVCYVLALLSLFFSIFSVGGVLLFKDANPFYFGNVVFALQTLLQVMSQDNWSTVMRTCMIGCRHFGASTGNPVFDDACDETVSGQGVGWWGAAYFVIFMIGATMVISNLMVGVIISSMELLREGYQEETMVWDNVRRIQRAYDIKAENIHRMLELWEMMDKSGNGFLTFEETQPVMDLVNLKVQKQFEIFVKNDTSKDGQISFHEFCELLLDVGRKRLDPACCESPEQIAAERAEQRRLAKGGGLLAALTVGKGEGNSVNIRSRQNSQQANTVVVKPLQTASGKTVKVIPTDGGEDKVYEDGDADMNATTNPVKTPRLSLGFGPRTPRKSSAEETKARRPSYLTGVAGGGSSFSVPARPAHVDTSTSVDDLKPQRRKSAMDVAKNVTRRLSGWAMDSAGNSMADAVAAAAKAVSEKEDARAAADDERLHSDAVREFKLDESEKEG